MTRGPRHLMVIMMTVAGMNGLITGSSFALRLVRTGASDVTLLTLTVFSVGAFALAYEVYRLRLVNERLTTENARLTHAVTAQSECIASLRRSQA